MIDREKVIQGLEFTKEMTTFDPSTGEYREPWNLNDLDKTTYDACVDAIALLKEQEPVEPIYGSHGERRCGECRNKFFVYKQLFCASCGRAAKWNDI